MLSYLLVMNLVWIVIFLYIYKRKYLHKKIAQQEHNRYIDTFIFTLRGFVINHAAVGGSDGWQMCRRG